MHVIKRSGEQAAFDSQKIQSAIQKSLQESQESSSTEVDSQQITNSLLDSLKENPTVEEVQDAVENELMRYGFHQTAKLYILHRDKKKALRERTESRDKSSFDESARYFQTPSQMYQFYSKYARWNPEKNRRETWTEAVQRVMTFFRSKVSLPETDWIELEESMLMMKSTCSQRILQMAGPALDRCNSGAYNCAAIGISSLATFMEILYLSMQGTGVGFSVEEEYVHRLPGIRRQRKNQDIPTFVIPDSTEGWCDAYALGIRTWFEGKDVKFDYSQIRPLGSRITIKGGTASGPDPLKSLLDFTRTKILNRQGSRLHPIDCHDIICKSGQIVHLGSTRRSALLSLFDVDDDEMRLAKQGTFWLDNEQRFMANDSIAYESKPSSKEFLSIWKELCDSGTGENGIFNREALAKHVPKRRKRSRWLTNPCQPFDAPVLTKQGIRKFGTLKQGDTIWSETGWTNVTKTWSTGIKSVYRYRTSSGTVYSTDNHRVLSLGSKTKVGDAVNIDSLVGPRQQVRLIPQAVLDGLVLGDGSVHTTSKDKIYLTIGKNDQDYFTSEVAHLIHESHTRHLRGAFKVSTTLKAEEIPYMYERKVPSRYLEGSYDEVASFLRGLFSANGSLCDDRITLKTTSKVLVEQIQVMLSSLGIQSYFTVNKPTEVSFRDENYLCKESYDINITTDRLQFAQSIGFLQEYKSEKLAELLEIQSQGVQVTYPIIEKSFIGEEEVFDITVDNEPHTYWTGGINSSNCGEVLLVDSGGLCNLSIVIARENDTKESLNEKVRLATIFGTIQSTLTSFSPYLRPNWAKTAEEERLLGVDITGQMDCPLLRPNSEGREDLLNSLLKTAQETNIKYAERLGINPSVAITCIKPSGNSAQLYNCSSGVHPRFAPYYIRRFRAGRFDPLTQMMIDARVAWNPEVGQPRDKCSVVVFDFPIKSPDGAITKDDMSAVDMLENWLVWKTHWTEHTVSATVSIGDNEWFQAGNWVYEHWNDVTGISFLPRDGGIYSLAPYEAISQEEYESRESTFPKLDFSKLAYYETTDSTESLAELACSSGNCET